jgi:hypothetical protein
MCTLYNCSRIFTAQLITYCTVHVGERTCTICTLYRVYIHIWERVQDEKKQDRQKCPAGTRQTDGKNWGLVWRNRKKISQIIKDYFHLPFFLLLFYGRGNQFSAYVTCFPAADLSCAGILEQSIMGARNRVGK